MLYDESGISPAVAAERGYYTARTRSEVPESFKDYQRKPGLVVPMFSPDGETVGYQLRPDKPRKGGPKYISPGGISPVVDVHPRMLEEARHGDGPLLITEGAKTGDAATSRGIATAVLAGVWMWCVPKVKPYRLKPCFDHVRLTGREVFVAFDSDCMTKAGVQDALAALVGALEARGAAVKVIYLPDAADGSGAKQGADDYLASKGSLGGTVKEMFMLARDFSPADIGKIRLSRDQKLRAGVEDLERRWWREEWKGRGGHTERDIALKLIEAASRSGKVHEDGIRVQVSWGALQVGAKVARRTLAKALARLEERGFCYRDNEGRRAEARGAFVLRAKVDQGRERATQATRELRACDPGGLLSRGVASLPDVPRLRWPRPKFTPRRGTVSGTRKVRESKPLPPRDRIERLGKIRGAVVDALEIAGGSCTLAELCEALHRKRARDVKRRILPELEDAGIITIEGDTVVLADDWREALDAERRAKGEIEADELAEEDRKRKSRAYRERDRTPISKPTAAGLAAVERSHEKRAEHIAEHDEHQASARAADLEHKRFVKRFVYDRLRALGRIRLELLQQILRESGGTPSYALPAAKSLGCTVERLPEFENQEFVFAPREWVA
jgi:ribosomal protein S19E (S16A)